MNLNKMEILGSLLYLEFIQKYNINYKNKKNQNYRKIEPIYKSNKINNKFMEQKYFNKHIDLKI